MSWKTFLALAMLSPSLVAFSAESPGAEGEKRVFMGVNRNLSEKIVRNAKIALRDSCRAKPGESVVVLVDKEPQRVQCAQALEAAAVELGLRPMIIDLSVYSGLVHDPSFVHNDQKYPTDRAELESRVLKPARRPASPPRCRCGMGLSRASFPMRRSRRSFSARAPFSGRVPTYQNG